MQRKSSGSTAQQGGSSFLQKKLSEEENPHFVNIFGIIFLYKKFSKFSINKIKTINDKFRNRHKLCVCGIQQGYEKSVISPEKETLDAVFPPFLQKSLQPRV